MNQPDLLGAAVLAGGVYGSLRVLLTVLYPAVASYAWQIVIGPEVARRWPTLVQSADQSRLSYLPSEAEQPFVIRLGLLPPPIDDITQGLRDGLLLGVFVALVPDLFRAGMLTVLFGAVIGKGAWRVVNATGAWRTDNALWTAKELLMYFAAVKAVSLTGLF
jgi:hypothetical protein